MNRLFLLLFAISILAVGSCYDPCTGVSCVNGDCNKSTGECECREGYEGPQCDKTISSKIFGSYSFSETCYPSGYYIDTARTFQVTPVSNSNVQFKLNRIWGEPIDLTCTFLPDGINFTFPNVVLEEENPTTAFRELRMVVLKNGEVSEDGSRIHIEYLVFDDTTGTVPMDSCLSTIIRN